MHTSLSSQTLQISYRHNITRSQHTYLPSMLVFPMYTSIHLSIIHPFSPSHRTEV
jgi:hypothetical protein